MRFVLLLGSFGAGCCSGEAPSAEVQDQNRLAFAQLKPPFVSFGSPRRLDGGNVDSCASACEGFQCFLDDKRAWSDQMSSLRVHDEESMRLGIALAGQAAGAACYHRAAIQCSNTSSECTGILQLDVDHEMIEAFPCICEACPNYLNAIIKVIPIAEHLLPDASNSGVIQDLMSELCPAMATVECMITALPCLDAGFLDSETGRAFEYLAAMKPQCLSSNLPTDYTEAEQFVYASPSSCPYISSTQSPTSTRSPSQSGAVTLQQTFLAGTFWLLSILNGM